MKYWIIDLEEMSGTTKEAHGPFKSIAEAEKWLRDDAGETFQLYNEPAELGADRDWAAPVLIVEEKKKLRQVPVVSFTINLEAAI